MGADVVALVQNVFSTSQLPEHLNESNIVLILKKQNPILMSDIRPITLCNVSYKIIS